jgi:large subunit ribosomal protein L4
MIAAKTFNLKGEAVKDTNLPEELFGVKVKPTLLAQAVRVYLSNQRQSPAKTKTRGEVAKTTAKMFKQKGTGRARHGSYAAPIFVGGGISHGPSGEQNYHLNMPQKMKKLAFLGALSAKAAKGEVKVVTGAEASTGKTKEVAWLAGKALVISSSTLTNFNRAARNLKKVQVVNSGLVNTYSVLAFKELIITPEALGELKKQYVA